MEDNKEIIVEETTQEEVTEKQPSKFVTGLKKHGKRIAVFAAIAGGVVAGFVLGKKYNSNDDSEEEYDYYDDTDGDSDTESETE